MRHGEAIEPARGLVREGLELISDEARWARHAYARDRQGRRVEPGSRRPRPVAWCLAGCLLEVEQRASVADGDAYETPTSVLDRPSARFAVAVTATWLSCEHAFWDEPGAGWTLERALRFAGIYLDSLPGQIACANDRPETTHADVCQVLAGADKLLIDGAPNAPTSSPLTDRDEKG